ncbi:hypothetical protein [Thiocapsa sp. N5-Cardenillas]|uniref:hypothetical protein n=1 Tax=Thiocapsa sp. N5-Cardenillas TaxID=3137397 RepID=UPI0035B0BBDF
MNNVVDLPVSPWREPQIAVREGIDPAVCLKSAIDEHGTLNAVVILGIRRDGTLAGWSSPAHMADTLLLIDRCRRRLFEGVCAGDGFYAPDDPQ